MESNTLKKFSKIGILLTILMVGLVFSACNPLSLDTSEKDRGSISDPKTLIEMAKEEIWKLKSKHMDTQLKAKSDTFTHYTPTKSGAVVSNADEKEKETLDTKMNFDMDSKYFHGYIDYDSKEHRHYIPNNKNKNADDEDYYDNVKYSSELYGLTKEGDLYVRTGISKAWAVKPYESASSFSMTLDDLEALTEDVLKQSDLKKTDDEYILSFNMKDVADTDFARFIVPFDYSHYYYDEVESVLSGKVKYVFDKKTLFLKSVDIADVRMTFNITVDMDTADDMKCTNSTTVTVDCKYKQSEFNKIKRGEVKPSEKIIDQAKKSEKSEKKFPRVIRH